MNKTNYLKFMGYRYWKATQGADQTIALAKDDTATNAAALNFGEFALLGTDGTDLLVVITDNDGSGVRGANTATTDWETGATFASATNVAAGDVTLVGGFYSVESTPWDGVHTLFSARDYGYGGSWTLTTDDSGSNTRIIGNYKPQGNSSGTSFIFITVTGGLSSGWNHIAWSRNSDAHRIFVDGTQVGSTVNDSIDLPYDPAQADVGIGIERKNGGASYSKLFKFDDFRLTKGVGIT